MARTLPASLLALCVGTVMSAEPAGQRLLLGFERAEVEGFAEGLKAQVSDAQDVLGRPYARVEMKGGRITREWGLFEGNASQGKWAAGLGLTRWPDRPMPGVFSTKKSAPFENRDAVMHYNGLYADGDWTRLFNTSGIHHLFLPTDWSDYDLLRLDVFCRDLTLEWRLAVEDEDVLPPVVRVMQVPPGQWTTLELDLRAAAKARGLDPAKITSMAVAATNILKGDFPAPKDLRNRHQARFALLDNIRLCRRDVAVELPVVRDASPYELLPGYYRETAGPKPRSVDPDKPDHSPLKPEEPMVIKTGAKRHTVARMGWVSAYDNNHLSVGFEVATFWGAKVLQTVDGGKQWTGLDGKPEATKLDVMDFIDGGGNSDVVDRFGDVVVTVFGLGCGGPSVYHPRIFTKQLSFLGAGKGWSLRELRAFADCEPRHCSATQTAFRAEGGRLWLGYGVLSRLNRTCTHVRYSDDDGLSWRPIELGKTGRVPGSLWPADRRLDGTDFGTYVKSDPAPCLVELGKGFACLWHNRREKSGQHVPLHFARHDGERWLPTETVPYPQERTELHSLPRLHAVSLGGKEIFVLTAYANGVLHYRDGAWTRELPEAPASVTWPCVAGGKTLVLIAAIPQPGGKSRGSARLTAPVVFRAWQRGPDGRWTGPRDLAREEEPLPLDETWAGFQVPRFSPPNFVPIVWANGGEWLKVLRVPVLD
ncbi:MAG: hypothetical protein FJ291_14060 [Planctomycetes bacterium]|nr:hypothetical protein [Planctomycetota bacterium]